MIEETLAQEIKKALDTQFHMFQQKCIFHKFKAFFSAIIGQLYSVLNIKKSRLWKISFSKFSFGYEEVISFFAFLITISLIVAAELLNHSLECSQFPMTFY
ncbi:MAG: hypothetical protein K2Y08_00920 [Alphaproteobacteria bacterium]|nr:hypothetical protein [Alphaproteobacteria bacterium]